jgi:hypothetical protein
MWDLPSVNTRQVDALLGILKFSTDAAELSAAERTASGLLNTADSELAAAAKAKQAHLITGWG